MSETKVLELKLPKRLWDTLVWYMRHTARWVSNDMVDQCAGDYILSMVESYLQAESDNPVDAADHIKAELSRQVAEL